MRAITLAAVAALSLAGTLHAQEWPARPVTIVVPTSSSSGSDIIGRAVSPRLGALWKQAVVVDNRLGASGAIGIGAAAKAPADGYTLLFTPNTITMLGSLYKNLGWDVEQSFEPVTLLAKTVLALVVHSEVPAKTVAELVALAKSRPGQLNYASPGIGTPQHLHGELFKQTVGADIVHVPYKTIAAANTDLAGGRTQMAFVSVSAIMPLAKAGKVRILATIGEQRTPGTPEVPTFREAGFDGLQAESWIAAFVPRGTPRAIVDRITRDLGALLANPEFQQELTRADLAPNTGGGGQKELAGIVKADVARWKKVISDGNISAE